MAPSVMALNVQKKKKGVTPTQTFKAVQRKRQKFKCSVKKSQKLNISHSTTSLNPCKFPIFSPTNNIFLTSPIHTTYVYNILSAPFVLLLSSV